MSPIIELQRRMVEVGRIRAGEKGEKGEPRKLDRWRLTSKDKVRLDDAAGRWGGGVRAWAERKGEFELYTETAALPIMLLPGQLPTTWYELWSKGGCQRRCDGQHELISDSACLCGDERECKPHTRLSVLLPDLPGIGSWMLSSTGWNAAAELGGAADLLQRASAQGVLIPARLRLEARTQVQTGKTRHFAVPVIDIDVSFRDLLGTQGALSPPSEMRALPSGYIPLADNGGNGVSLEEGLAATETQTVTRTSRSAAPIPMVNDELDFGGAPVPPDTTGASPPDSAPSAAEPSEAPAPSHEENIAALNALVTSLSEQGVVSKRQVWVAVARMRQKPVDELIELYGGISDGELHWSPLREVLRSEEASELRKRLGAKWAETRVTEGAVA